MARIDLKGIAKVRAKGREYHYAWRGGPRLKGKPGSAEYVASFLEAHENLKVTDNGRFRALVNIYRGSKAFTDLAETTRKQWAPWLDRIGEHFGPLSYRQFNRVNKIRPVIRKWRQRWADTPRTADYGMQVLSRVLSFGVEEGKLTENVCYGISALYSANRSEIIWTDADITRIKAVNSPEIGWAVDLAAHTGLRFSDLIRVAWSHISEKAIILTTGKSKHRKEAVVPIYGALRDLLARIPKRATTVLTSSRRLPWTRDGLASSFNKAKHRADMADADLHFHDLRGTACTRFYVANLTEREIAEIMGWEEEHVRKIIRRYVGRTAALEAMIQRIDKA